MSLEIRGCGTALVTPFHRDGSLDEAALRRMTDLLVTRLPLFADLIRRKFLEIKNDKNRRTIF